MSQYDFVETIRCKDAKELVEHLRPSNPQWGSGHTSSWIFRGHADSQWKLLPSARRSDGREKLKSLLHKQCGLPLTCSWSEFNSLLMDPELLKASPEKTHALRCVMVRAEREAVMSFVSLADELGLYIPDWFGPDAYDDQYTEEYHHVPWAGSALAQHHGIPTNLLDWTRRPLAAAYFSTDASKAPSARDLTIWALDTSVVSSINKVSPWHGLITYAFPRSYHDFLRAQDSVFTVCGDHQCFTFMEKHGHFPDLLDFVATFHTPLPAHFMRRFDLCRTHAASLKQILIRERITRAHMMPTFDNVADTVKDMW